MKIQTTAKNSNLERVRCRNLIFSVIIVELKVITASQNLMYIQTTHGSHENEDSDSIGLGLGLKILIYNRLPSNAQTSCWSIKTTLE